ncbi:hypothetical protein L1049_019458 [Liquidambar formosana]|uniref:Uncharacterized protein n=1 Tax=Liquidambar formosana TaxID=63359 RepID=A0AAP0S5W6_LIQFO
MKTLIARNIFSIGPFHSPTAEKHDHLLAMQEHKWWYTLYLLNRTKNINQKEILAQCGEAILEREQKVRRRYAEKIKFEPQELMEIMLVDGCFILELFLRSLLQDFTEEDPIFHNAWMIPTLRHDLALLENQIPFFILEELFNIVLRHFPEHLPCSITDLALSFFHPDLNLNQEAIRKKCGAQGGIYSHLLDILHNFYLPTSPKADPKGNQTWGFRKCATKLSEAGVEFEKGKEDHLLDICFSEDKGAITIPPLRIDETTKSLLMNLIAFEQCLGSTQQHITSYAILLKCLVQSPADIELLEKEDIIKNELGGVGDVLTLFNNILRDVVPKDFYFGKLCEDVNAYQQSWWQWHRLMAFLMQGPVLPIYRGIEK